MFRLFQLDVPRSEFDAVNEMGWTEAMAKFPRVEAHMALTTSGSEGWVSSLISISNMSLTSMCVILRTLSGSQ